jgi:hypothetical protein
MEAIVTQYAAPVVLVLMIAIVALIIFAAIQCDIECRAMRNPTEPQRPDPIR